MPLYTDPRQIPDSVRGAVAAIGNFDGVHLGHREIVRRQLALAKRLKAPALALTFDPHPLTLLRPDEAPPPLTTMARRAELLENLGVDAVLAYPTDARLLALEAQDFLERVLGDQLAIRGLAEGEDFRFGKGRAGDVSMLKSWAARRNVALEVVQPVSGGTGAAEALVSSSRIRDLVVQGDVAGAARLLQRPHRLIGRVVRGAQRGGTIGFPTANLDDLATVAPGLGVYAAVTWIGERAHVSAVNVGPNPTFGEHHHKVEVHVLDFSGDLYGAELAVDFYARLREIQTFASLDALRSQLRADVEFARKSVPSPPAPSDLETHP